ncbi:MAG: flagellar motor stator protein MotA [Methylomonas sp.]|jgi:chemotaxis protein MotA|uniref:flagellar motor stator protein MotA n=1 Tax=Methylomonas sp. TaxID=418 RepID=UPI0025E20388|nr:flagellar motor stator protein MotA [Methylomonas sp.]MCK9605324.1 flagellar motor stator protein MotA [Methylomonas sp.]
MLVIFGYVVILGCVLGGFALGGGHVGVLFQPVEFLILLGAGSGAFLASNSLSTIKASLAGGFGTLKPSPYNKDYYLQLLMSFNALCQKARKEGFLSLEKVVDDPDYNGIFGENVAADHHLMEFICDKLRLILTGVDYNQLEDIIDAELDVHLEEGHVPVRAVQRVGDGMPAFGIVAAVMGVVHTMESVGIPPTELGKLIAAALVGTFLGILVAYGFVNPVAAVMENRLEDQLNAYKCTQAGLLNCAKGTSPTMTVEFMRTIIPHHVRPDFLELEEQLKAGKG